MEKAVRLVREDNVSIMAATKVAWVPRITLGDRLRNYKNPMEEPKVGRLKELLQEDEEAIVKCVTLYAEFQYPMTKKDLMTFVQAYICCGERC
jgi:hypothetical protein